jgi:hypothetical protein
MMSSVCPELCPALAERAFRIFSAARESQCCTSVDPSPVIERGASGAERNDAALDVEDAGGETTGCPGDAAGGGAERGACDVGGGAGDANGADAEAAAIAGDENASDTNTEGSAAGTDDAGGANG